MSPGISPGPVQADEHICRGIRAPIDLKNGEVSDHPFQIKELVGKNLSGWRQSDICFSESEMMEKLRRWAAEREGGKLHSVFRARAEEIRGIMVNDEGLLIDSASDVCFQAVCVLDKVHSPDEPFHASLGFTDFVCQLARKRQELVRLKLKLLMKRGAIVC